MIYDAEEYAKRCKYVAKVETGGGYYWLFNGETPEDAVSSARECYARFGWHFDESKVKTYPRRDTLPRTELFTGETAHLDTWYPCGVQDLH